jgi:NADPH-dependent 2,4-dienoyl-CoA reductase/sulfur reductase-like enzyme
VRSVLLSKTSGYYPRRRVTYDYDLVVIGSGPAGERGAVTAANLGKRVLVIEKAVDPGGAAVHTGTLPSKTLRETALFLSGRDQREVYGVGVTIDDSLFVPKLLSRKATVKRLEVDRIRRAFKDSGVEVIRGVGHLVGPHQVHIEVAGKSPSDALTREITSHFILVATGSVPHRPGELPWSDHAVEDSDSILELDVMPGSLTILGAGVIGCEYAACSRRWASRWSWWRQARRDPGLHGPRDGGRARARHGRAGRAPAPGGAWGAVTPGADGDSVHTQLGGTRWSRTTCSSPRGAWAARRTWASSTWA